MRKLQAILALVAILVASVPTPRAEAQIPVTDIAHIIQTVAHYLARAEEIYQRYQQIEHELNMLEHDLKNLERAESRWRDLETLMVELSDVIQQGEGVVYSRSDLEPLWLETFPGSVRIDPVETPGGWQEIYERTSRRALDTQWGVMRNVRHQSTRFHTSQRVLDEIKQKSEAAEGNLEATQVSNMLMAFQAEEQTKTLQMLSALTNAFVVQAAYRLTREMQAVAEVHAWLDEARRPVEPIPASARYGLWG
jgi:type IV secretion system protein TrbJ